MYVGGHFVATLILTLFVICTCSYVWYILLQPIYIYPFYDLGSTATGFFLQQRIVPLKHVTAKREIQDHCRLFLLQASLTRGIEITKLRSPKTNVRLHGTLENSNYTYICKLKGKCSLRCVENNGGVKHTSQKNPLLGRNIRLGLVAICRG